MSQSRQRTFKAHLEPIGVGAGWSDPLQVSGLGRSGEVTNLELRGGFDDGTTGTAEVVLFEAPIPTGPEGFSSNRVVKATVLDPAAIADGDKAMYVTALAVAPSLTVSSATVNLRDITKSTTLYAATRPDWGLFLSVRGVTGKVHVYLRGEAN